jgi:hypothetical protein
VPLKIAIVGSTGLIGSMYKQHYSTADGYSSENIEQLPHTHYDLVICTAPSSNRRWAEQHPEADAATVDQLISVFNRAQIKQLVLIGTVDSIQYSNSVYGANRLRLEQAVKKHADHYIVRLCTLIDPAIKKNVLFDLKHNQFVESIDSRNRLQWYCLRDLPADVDRIRETGTRDCTLVSEPIATSEIIARFFPELLTGTTTGTPMVYNIQPYMYNKEYIFNCMEQYLK